MKTPRLVLLVALILLAAALRLNGLDRHPLRGDEAFTVRYWAAPPDEVLATIARFEPHPFGAFFGFFLWRQVAGSTEFAMRLFPALVNLLGVAAMYAAARRLFRAVPRLNTTQIGLLAALLWAVSPTLIWHSQDVRNYALWSGLSAVSLWLMLRVTDSGELGASRISRRDWLLLLGVQALALYVFFLEAFLLAGYTLYVLLFRRAILRRWLLYLLSLAVLLIPWLLHAVMLAGSGYRGAINIETRLRDFPFRLLFGDLLPPHDVITLILFMLCAVALIGLLIRAPRVGGLLILLVAVPSVLLLIAATRIQVRDPRYILGILPAILLLLGLAVSDPGVLLPRRARTFFPIMSLIIPIAVVAIVGLTTLAGLAALYGPEYRKSPDWYGLRMYLLQHVGPDDLVIIASVDAASGLIDPAFAYYYSGDYLILPYPGADTDAFVRRALAEHPTVWFIVTGTATEAVNRALLTHGRLISDEAAGRNFLVRQYVRGVSE